ncbi:MAG: recombinase family protein [Desulfovibrionaceae bacterium]|nr:recombinase family protein [Desulfovibrionaceae bacterium]
MRMGYARVSTLEQSLEVQKNALARAGCERIFEDQAGGAAADRPGLTRLMDMLRPGDAVVVWRLDRLGRSLSHLIALAGDLERRGAALVSLTESLDTESPGGRLVFHLFAALAEFERGLIRERTRAGLAAARARGRMGGRPKRLDAARRRMAVGLYLERKTPVAEICRLFAITKPTLYAYVREQHGEPKSHKGGGSNA